MDEHRESRPAETSVHVDGLKLDTTKFKLSLTNRLQPTAFDPRAGIEFEARFAIDAAAYERLAATRPEPLYTVEISIDLNPWHRRPRNWRQRLLKARDCAWWAFRRHVLRRQLLEHMTLTVPNCQITGEKPPATQGESNP